MANESGRTPKRSGSDKPNRSSSSSRPPSGSGRSSSDRPKSDRPSSSRPQSGSGRSSGSSSNRGDRPDRPDRGDRPGRGGSARFGKDEQRDDRRIELKNEPAIPEEVLH